MVMIKDSKGIERYTMSQSLVSILKRYSYKINKEDSMLLGIFFGKVGGGKSLVAQKWGYALDSSLENQIDRVAFDQDEVVNAILNCRKQVIIGDEGISIVFSRNAMTKTGRLIVEILAQCRQKNLAIFICVPDLLSVDNLILESANFVSYVWETRQMINNRTVTVKGNVAFYPNLKNHPFKTKIIQYLKQKKRNPLKKLKRPEPFLMEAGNPFGEGFKAQWYPVGEKEYKRKKEDILKKYVGEKKSAFKQEVEALAIKRPTRRVDYNLVDHLLRSGLKHMDIAKTAMCSVSIVKARSSKLNKLFKSINFGLTNKQNTMEKLTLV